MTALRAWRDVARSGARRSTAQPIAWATTLDVDKSIRVNGTEVPAGKYSVWMIPRQGPWTVFLDRDARLFHFQKPDSAADQIHIRADPEPGAHAEMLTWSFPAVSGDAARLQMTWGTTTVALQVVIQPSRPVELAANVRATYVGEYDMRMVEGIGWPSTGRLEVMEPLQSGPLPRRQALQRRDGRHFRVRRHRRPCRCGHAPHDRRHGIGRRQAGREAVD